MGFRAALDESVEPQAAKLIAHAATVGGGFHARGRVLLRQPDDTQTGAVTRLQMRLVVEYALDQLRGVGSHACRPAHDSRRRRLQMCLMALGPMLVLGSPWSLRRFAEWPHMHPPAGWQTGPSHQFLYAVVAAKPGQRGGKGGSI
jgi:hypothetical protein